MRKQNTLRRGQQNFRRVERLLRLFDRSLILFQGECLAVWWFELTTSKEINQFMEHLCEFAAFLILRFPATHPESSTCQITEDEFRRRNGDRLFTHATIGDHRTAFVEDTK